MGWCGRTRCSHEARHSKSDVYALQPHSERLEEPGHERQEVACWLSCLRDKTQVLGSGTASDFCLLGMCTGVSILGHRNSHRHVHTYALINQPLEQSVFKKRKQRKAYIYNLNSADVTVPTARQVNCSRWAPEREPGN